MFDALTPLGLATLPRQGIGARIVRRLGRVGAALHGVVAGRLRRRPSGTDSPVAPEAEGSTAAMPARAPRQPRRRPIFVPKRRDDLAFTEAAFPDLTPAAREFFNTPVEDCDPAMLSLVLEQLAGAIAGMMTPQDGMQDARDVFLALNSRLGALTGGMQGTPPETAPATPAEPADPATPAATGPQAASPDLPGSAPAPGSAVPQPDGSASAQCEAATAAAWSDQPAAPPVAQPPSDPSLIDAGTNSKRAPHDRSFGPRQFRRRSFCSGRRFAAGRFAVPERKTLFHGRNIVGCVPRPLRLLCYAACAGPPALAGAPNPARRLTKYARDHRMVVPRYLIPAA